jgi:hypothetical protein
MNYRQTAMRVAQNKAKRPELYCPASRCLWRTGGGYCPRHQPDDREPECTCTQVDVDLFDARFCEAHGGRQ